MEAGQMLTIVLELLAIFGSIYFFKAFAVIRRV